ncbi:uncharacterized protein LOC127260340 [Andrographis paniculata]|uniref:uncharacterized protein LOC127260340 n=1 Tax=Andrographis paniculata TaxID=175694 RepID=UPI0021E70404|nr:uncharacterized protein LOC127260340 [Andrographis paniculata]
MDFVTGLPGIKRFDIWRKLSPCYIGSYTIVERIGKLAYLLKLPSELADETKVLQLDKLKLENDLSCDEKTIRILDKSVKALRNRNVHLMKVLCIDMESRKPRGKRSR